MILHVIMVFCRLAMYGGNAAYEFSFYVYMVSIFYKKKKKKRQNDTWARLHSIKMWHSKEQVYQGWKFEEEKKKKVP